MMTTTIDSRAIFATNLISEEDYDVLDQVLKTPLQLATKVFDIANLISKVKVELSPEIKRSSYNIDAAAVVARLAQLKKQHDAVYKEYSEARDEWYRLFHMGHRDETLGKKCQRLEIEVGAISCSIRKAEELLEKSARGEVSTEDNILGEFISSPYPKVVLYYRNIQDASRYTTSGFVPVFVHEMFHAWNYFEAGSHDRSVLEIDEPMVEYATLYFLKSLADMLEESDSKKAYNISRRADWQERKVRQKKEAIGSTAAYGFGICLDEKILTDAPLWLETYAGKSASLNPADSKVAKVMNSLAPFYPFDNEDKVFKSFKDVIFAKAKTRSAGVTRISQTDILKSCLDTMSKDDFTLEDVYAFEPIFKTLYPGNMHLRDKLRQLLQKLVAQGDVIRVSSGCYKKS